jgi:cholest-4-en-3-one 26-monooxygenase
MLFSSGNFDPNEITDPDTCDLSRDPNPRTPRMCLGKHVAAFEMKILLEEFFQHTKSVRLAGKVSYVKDNYTRGIYSLPVTVEPA